MSERYKCQSPVARGSYAAQESRKNHHSQIDQTSGMKIGVKILSEEKILVRKVCRGHPTPTIQGEIWTTQMIRKNGRVLQRGRERRKVHLRDKLEQPSARRHRRSLDVTLVTY